LGTEEPFFTRLLEGLRGKDKRIVLIDMGTDDPGYSLYREVREKIQAYAAKLEEDQPHSEQWQSECSDLLLDYQIASARENEYRELVMENQVRSLAEDNPGKR
jgi:hypothetical protein